MQDSSSIHFLQGQVLIYLHSLSGAVWKSEVAYQHRLATPTIYLAAELDLAFSCIPRDYCSLANAVVPRKGLVKA